MSVKLVAAGCVAALALSGSSAIAMPETKNYRMGTLTVLYFEEAGVTDWACTFDRAGYEHSTVRGSEAIYSASGIRLNFPTVYIRGILTGGHATLTRDSPGSTTGTLQFARPGVQGYDVYSQNPPQPVRNLTISRSSNEMTVTFDLLMSLEGKTCGIKVRGDFVR